MRLSSVPFSGLAPRTSIAPRIFPAQPFVNVSSLRTYRLFSTTVEPKQVPMELVKKLRERTQAGYLDCKHALAASDNDVDKSIEWLRQKGALRASAKADRETKEGLVGVTNTNSQKAYLFEMNTETDFVSRGETFRGLTKTIASALEHFDQPTIDLDQLSKVKLSDRTIAESIVDAVSKLKENIQMSRVTQLSLKPEEGLVCSYVHQNVLEDGKIGMGRIGTAIALACKYNDMNKKQLTDFGEQLAMQVAAFPPKYLTKEEVPSGTTDKIDEVVFLEQEYGLDEDKKKVKEVIQDKSKELNTPIHVQQFVRFACGEK
jgi:elongation factor Ts